MFTLLYFLKSEETNKFSRFFGYVRTVVAVLHLGRRLTVLLELPSSLWDY